MTSINHFKMGDNNLETAIPTAKMLDFLFRRLDRLDGLQDGKICKGKTWVSFLVRSFLELESPFSLTKHPIWQISCLTNVQLANVLLNKWGSPAYNCRSGVGGLAKKHKVEHQDKTCLKNQAQKNVNVSIFVYVRPEY